MVVNILFTLIVVVVAFEVVPHAIGLSLHETSRSLLRSQGRMLTTMQYLMVVILGWSAISFPGVFGSQIAIGGVLFGYFFGRNVLVAVAGANRLRTPKAIAETRETTGGNYLFLHISDVHATAPENRVPIGGGKAGNPATFTCGPVVGVSRMRKSRRRRRHWFGCLRVGLWVKMGQSDCRRAGLQPRVELNLGSYLGSLRGSSHLGGPHINRSVERRYRSSQDQFEGLRLGSSR
jgi:hypothetical protein